MVLALVLLAVAGCVTRTGEKPPAQTTRATGAAGGRVEPDSYGAFPYGPAPFLYPPVTSENP
jgi:hypothetical protein